MRLPERIIPPAAPYGAATSLFKGGIHHVPLEKGDVPKGQGDYISRNLLKIFLCVLCKKAVDKLRHLCYTISYESVEGNGTFRRSFFAENRCHRLRAAAKSQEMRIPLPESAQSAAACPRYRTPRGVCAFDTYMKQGWNHDRFFIVPCTVLYCVRDFLHLLILERKMEV